jgi:hypothetical protein
VGRVRGRELGNPGVERDQRHDFWGVVLDAPKAWPLARFYADLLGWHAEAEPGADYVAVAAPDGVAYLATQTSQGYRRPTWPNAAGEQQMMMHLDFEVGDLTAAVEHAQQLGATLAEHQPQNNVRVMLDPAGHPFCLYVG